MYKILVSDPLHPVGLAMLRESGHEVTELPPERRPELPELVAHYDALVVRSGTKVTADILAAGAGHLKVVGRAGVGVDNVDVKAATEHGILVINAPTANLMSATEHTFALMLAVARRVAVADKQMKEGVWDRKAHVGSELQGKTLGIIGFGRIGQRVARRAQAFDMTTVAFDPFIDAQTIQRFDTEALDLDTLLGRADFVTLHTPLSESTRNLLDTDKLALMKDTAVIINCGRGGVLDEGALLAALEAGTVGGAGIDVYASEPPTDFALAQHPRVVATPHLGASTHEAQERISTETAKMVIAALDGSLAVTAVNLPFRPTGVTGEPYLRLGETLGQIAWGLLGDAPLNRLRVELAGIDDALHTPITVAAVKGALEPVLAEAVNYVNAERVAAERDVAIERLSRTQPSDYPHLVQVHLEAGDRSVTVAGTLFHDDDLRVVSIDGFPLEFRPKDVLLVVRNRDVPGVVGRVGTVLGDATINIAEIHLARRPGSDQALAIVRLDARPSDGVIAAIAGLEPVVLTQLVDLSQ
ncbi:MAG: phosphoglycerate dehydrogenase [Acidobacteriota bacterium]